MGIMKANTRMDYELVSRFSPWSNFPLPLADFQAFIIQPQNGTGRSDNTTWDAEYTLIVSDWYIPSLTNWRSAGTPKLMSLGITPSTEH